MPTDRLAVVRAWLGARWSSWNLRTPAHVERRQARLWRAMAPVIGERLRRVVAALRLLAQELADDVVARGELSAAALAQFRKQLAAYRALAQAAPATVAPAAKPVKKVVYWVCVWLVWGCCCY